MNADNQVKTGKKRRYTKGPWRYGCDWAEYGAIADCGECSEYVYGGAHRKRPFSKIPPMEQHANAMLISRAPEMLELLQKVVAKGGHVNQRWIDKAEMAIARATGTSFPKRLRRPFELIPLGQLLGRRERRCKAPESAQP